MGSKPKPVFISNPTSVTAVREDGSIAWGHITIEPDGSLRFVEGWPTWPGTKPVKTREATPDRPSDAI